MTDTETAVLDDDWWRGAVIYQIYPRSFQDSNGDGVGDLAGILRRLKHIADLGADAIWISPIAKSPMKDFGYDVSDYRDVDPLFGSLADFDALIAEAHRLGLKVMTDLVISHTSDQHPWFVESRASRDNAKADWYVWADAKPDGSPPNNWLSIFGGPAWRWDTRRMQYYLHNFLAEQPDLNFHTLAVQDALLDTARFWLDRGVDGFRLDTINFYFHSLGLEDNPALPPEARNASTAPAVNPYNFQDHLHDKSQPENLAFLERFRAVLDAYPARTSVGEVGDSQRGLEIAASYTSGGNRVHMCYSFEFLGPEKMGGTTIRDALEAFGDAAPDGWACWALSNHDVVRHATRWGKGEKDLVGYLKVLSALLMSLRGSVCLYQGEELGLGEADIAFEDLQDPYGKAMWPEFRGRDGCRTPMVWESAAKNAGFSDGKAWLPISLEQQWLAVDTQEGKDGALLEHYRRFLAFRRGQPPLVKGDIEFLAADEEVLVFTRSHGNEQVVCAFNLGARNANLNLGDDSPLVSVEGHGFQTGAEGGKIKLGPYGAWFGRFG